jgi:type I restriction enzyme S subunit
MSHYKPYPAYKDSGVEWLGRVPEHWQIKRLKHIANVQTGVAKGKDNEGKDTIEVPYLRVANVQDGYLSLDDVATIEIPREDLTRYSLQPGDVLMNEGGDFDKLGRGSVWQGEIEPCIHQNHVFAVRPTAVSSAWLNAFTGSLAAQFYFMGRAKQSTNLASISSSNIMELPVAIPPANEVDLLLAHLDRETVRIDALIEKKTCFIELLREKRQALITHAVTKGLDPSVKMKDSGVEWLGEVPEHWGVSPLKHLVRFRSGGTPSKDNLEFWSGDIPWASAKDLKQEVLADTIDHLNQSAIESGAASLVPSGSILVVVRGMILARLFPVVETLVPMAINQDLKALVPSEKLNSRYLAHLLRGSSTESLSRLEEAGHGTKALRMENWVSIELPVPPLHEQLAIIEMLDIQTARLDSLADKSERSIDLLKERRSALITAAVTGQIDLRDAACH